MKKSTLLVISSAFVMCFFFGPIIKADCSSTLQENYTNDDTDAEPTYDTNWLGQVFRAETSYAVKSVKVKVWQSGTPNNITVSIKEIDTLTGHPTSTDLCSGVESANEYQGDPGQLEEIELTGCPNLTASTTYALIVVADDSQVRWRENYPSPAYTYGQGEISADSGNTWTSYSNRDFMFEIYGCFDEEASTTESTSTDPALNTENAIIYTSMILWIFMIIIIWLITFIIVVKA